MQYDHKPLLEGVGEGTTTPFDLWVLPTPRQSRWFSQLDWYLNWQMCKGLAYAGLHLPAETYRVAEEYGVPVFPRDARTSSLLLVASRGRVPSERCLVLECEDSLKDWLQTIRGHVERLGVTNVRVFLPTGMSVKDAQKSWKGADTVSFVADLGAEQ